VKLLFDENLSPQLVEALADLHPGSRHVQDQELGSADDWDVWEYAKLHGLTIVSKDSDFHEHSVRVGAPPKVIWIRLGNCTTAAVEMLLRNSEQTLSRFADGETNCLVLGRG
jgi:predicted nuclease of predicted toxin-antitoxin system